MLRHMKKPAKRAQKRPVRRTKLYAILAPNVAATLTSEKNPLETVHGKILSSIGYRVFELKEIN